MIRCSNCGWGNSPERSSCEKCNSVLKSAVAADFSSYQQGSPSQQEEKNYSATLRGQEAAAPFWDQQNVRNCPHCGYPNMAQATQCIKCRHEFSNYSHQALQDKEQNEKINGQQPVKSKVQILEKEGKIIRVVEGENAGESDTPASFNKTFDPWRQSKKSKCFLEPIAAPNQKENTLIECIGSSVTLNRESLDPGNLSITSKVQAMIQSENGVFTIEDKSDMQTTFIQIAQPHVLKNGDIILMGDKKFRFWVEE